MPPRSGWPRFAALPGCATRRCRSNSAAVQSVFLQTGQVALEMPSAAGFEAIIRQLGDWGVSVDLNRLRNTYYRSRVLSPDQYSGLVRLLKIFAQQLSLMANQMMIQDAEAEAPMIRRARAYIEGHLADAITIDHVASALHVCTFYFCRVFKKATGLTFTEYLSRTRVERAKNLLLNPHLRVSEIAYSVGFQSLTHFNRRFHEFTGESPTHFRDGAANRNKGMARNLSARSSTLRSLTTTAMPLAA
jgi:AraC-like DNA-binding protein